MDSQQNLKLQPDSQQSDSKRNKVILIIASAIIGVLILAGSLIGFTAYLSVQKQAEEAKVAKEKAEEEKRVAQRIRDEAEKKAADERKLREEAEAREKLEKEAREERERAARQEQERLQRELEEAERQKQEEEASKPSGQVSDVQMKAEVRIINGEFDAGFFVSGLVKNISKSGDLKVLAFLTCSEGEWTRTQHLYFSGGQTFRLTYFFHEPTVNATGCQARILTKPL